MKRTVVFILSIFAIILICIYMNYKEVLISKNDSKKFNLEYEFYSNQESILGTDITTLINKAIDNNEKCEISKDEKGLYISDDKYSINIEIYMPISQKTYPMEALKKAGMDEFTRYFGQVKFKCTDIKYHEKTGRISKIVFSSEE